MNYPCRHTYVLKNQVYYYIELCYVHCTCIRTTLLRRGHSSDFLAADTLLEHLHHSQVDRLQSNNGDYWCGDGTKQAQAKSYDVVHHHNT